MEIGPKRSWRGYRDTTHTSEIRYLQEMPGFHLLAVVSDDIEWRWQRYQSSWRTGGRNLTFPQFEEIDRREREGLDANGIPNPHADNLNLCIRLAERQIRAGSDRLEIEQQIDAWIKSRRLSLKNPRHL